MITNKISNTHDDFSDSNDSVIKIRNLSKVYRDFWGRVKVNALKSLSMNVRKGEIFGLLGPNGSGKTTTMKLLLGLLFPTSGEISVLGRPADDVEKNRGIGYLPEESYLYRFLNADETLDFYGRLFNIKASERKSRIEQLLDLVGVKHARRRQLKEYSKGMTRRIGLAQALINDPELVMLDEPTSGLDPMGSREMKDLILKLKDQGKTVVMCSHQLDDVQDVCDRVAILYSGELKVLDSVKSLVQKKEETQIITGVMSDKVMSEIKDVLAKNNVELRSSGQPLVKLEELFLKIIKESQERPGIRYEESSKENKG